MPRLLLLDVLKEYYCRLPVEVRLARVTIVMHLQSNWQKEVCHFPAKQCVGKDAYYCYSLKSMLNDSTHIEYVVYSMEFRMQQMF